MESVNATYEIQTSLDSLALDLEKFEEQLMPQLDSLAKAIPEIYAGYASMVRTLVSTTLQVCKPNAKTSSRIALAVEVGARSIQAFGNYKAAKEHNRLLTKYLAIKRQHAENNLDKVSDLLPKINAKCTTSGKLFSKCASLRYALSELDSSKISRVAQIQYKALSLHRTNLYLSELCKYLKNEYSSWLNGVQRSKYDMPDYYLINQLMANEMFGDNLLEAYSKAADEETSLSGKQMMLLSDAQLSLMALGDKLCKIKVDQAQPLVAQLIEECGAHKHYAKLAAPVTNHLENDPEVPIFILGFLAIVAVICLLVFYFNADAGTKWLIGIIGVAAIFRTCRKGAKNANISYVNQGNSVFENFDRNIERACGKIERPDIDYSERNALKSAISGFFN